MRQDWLAAVQIAKLFWVAPDNYLRQVNQRIGQVIVQLRKKLRDNGGEPRLLLTIHGVGYKLAAE